MRELSWIILSVLIISCGQKHRDAPKEENISIPVKRNQDNIELYAILQFVISDQNLDRRTGLKPDPISIGKHFLMKRVIDTVGNSSLDSSFFEMKDGQLVIKKSHVFSVSYPTRNLTHADVEFMLQQTEALKNFQWDNSRLGFNATNRKEWYQFSVPLFSQDSSKVVMLMYWTCDQFMCRHDTPILLTKDQGHWTVQTGPTVMH